VPLITTSDRTFLVYKEDETRKFLSIKQADGIVAHLVHSLDAARMMLTIHRLHGAGVHHFAMAHDSFGVPASAIDFSIVLFERNSFASIPNLYCRTFIAELS